MKIESFILKDLVPFDGNARRGDVEAISESLRVNGQYRPIVVNIGTHTGRPNEVLVGNHTVEAAKLLALPALNAVIVDLDDEAVTRIVVSDNRTSDLAKYEDRELAELLGELSALEGTGYSQDDLDDLLILTADNMPEEITETGSADGEESTLVSVKLKLSRGTADAFMDALGDDPASVLREWLGLN